MCPACIASVAAMAAGAGSTGGILAICISKCRNLFRGNGLNPVRRLSSAASPPERFPRGERCVHSAWPSMGLVVAGAVSTGGLAALAVKVSRKKNGARAITPQSNERSSQHVHKHE
jgi:hypothetical protein